MYCKKCGNKLKQTDNYCKKCGNKIREENKNIVESKEGKELASLILGIVSLILSFSMSILAFPISVTGLILGLTCKNKSSEKTAGIILSIFSIVVEIITTMIIVAVIFIIGIALSNEDYHESFKADNVNYVWNCKADGEFDYSITLSLKENKNYVWAKYDDAINNAIYGTYSINENGENKYTLVLNSTHLLDNGAIQNYESISNYEVEFGKFNNLILTNLTNNKSYHCDEYYRD